MVSCRFHEFVSDPSIYPRYVEAAVGRALSLEEFLKTGERIWNLEKLFNLGAGLSRADDCLPGRCYEPIKGEASEGAVMKREQFETMLDEVLRGAWMDKRRCSYTGEAAGAGNRGI